jgi:hypothetical protein
LSRSLCHRPILAGPLEDAPSGRLGRRCPKIVAGAVSLGTQSQITAVRDPDGNLVELTQLGPGWLDHLKAHRAEGHDLVSCCSAHLRTTPQTGPS